MLCKRVWLKAPAALSTFPPHVFKVTSRVQKNIFNCVCAGLLPTAGTQQSCHHTNLLPESQLGKPFSFQPLWALKHFLLLLVPHRPTGRALKLRPQQTHLGETGVVLHFQDWAAVCYRKAWWEILQISLHLVKTVRSSMEPHISSWSWFKEQREAPPDTVNTLSKLHSNVLLKQSISLLVFLSLISTSLNTLNYSPLLASDNTTCSRSYQLENTMLSSHMVPVQM